MTSDELSGTQQIRPQLTFGLDTFGDVTVDLEGRPVPAHQVIRDVVEEAVVADQVGIDHFSVGEHHRDDFAISAPDVILAAIAARTERITVGTAVTVLSSDDPIRVYERFATIDAISNGRAEITAGRGSFIESFPLFGFDLSDYEILFEEKLDLLAKLRSEGPISWTGRTRAPLRTEGLHPTTERGSLPVWVAVGGSPESVVRAARHGLPLMLAIIGGAPARFAPFVDLYRRSTAGTSLPVGIHSPGFVADSDDEARDLLYPHFKTNRDRIGRERGWPPVSRAEYEREAREGALFVGSPETVAHRIADAVTTLGVDRFDLKYANGPMPHEHLTRSIELYGTQVIPRVRELLAAA
ncbi:LLM class flavin-dependent oxidoreductase [Cellulomonas fimi]|uniref:LLM class flavin-dependent oxidoreductase n=1 Tax=Cellulomonas fimi TaxID=1708 RepID=A0A7Y0QI91_CELFI|nr:LLM class flavin-dependent oxidoreductase [Cellulomonas fimi]NMR20943.1 LLM class flavin-dependent oxidoreductase [Cellulomonas fimi]